LREDVREVKVVKRKVNKEVKGKMEVIDLEIMGIAQVPCQVIRRWSV
tara:strand:- start:389 stop:529 length:141 start_codon:yes stop_codon:yes gene_type:complete